MRGIEVILDDEEIEWKFRGRKDMKHEKKEET